MAFGRPSRLERRGLLRCDEASGPVVLPVAVAALGRLALRSDLLRRPVVVVRVSSVHQLLGELAIPRQAFRLEVGTEVASHAGALVPVEPEPSHAVEDAVDHLGGRALDVGVLDAEDERAAVVPGEEPVEEGGAGAADVEVAGR